MAQSQSEKERKAAEKAAQERLQAERDAQAASTANPAASADVTTRRVEADPNDPAAQARHQERQEREQAAQQPDASSDLRTANASEPPIPGAKAQAVTVDRDPAADAAAVVQPTGNQPVGTATAFTPPPATVTEIRQAEAEADTVSENEIDTNTTYEVVVGSFGKFRQGEIRRAKDLGGADKVAHGLKHGALREYKVNADA